MDTPTGILALNFGYAGTARPGTFLLSIRSEGYTVFDSAIEALEHLAKALLDIYLSNRRPSQAPCCVDYRKAARPEDRYCPVCQSLLRNDFDPEDYEDFILYEFSHAHWNILEMESDWTAHTPLETLLSVNRKTILNIPQAEAALILILKPEMIPEEMRPDVLDYVPHGSPWQDRFELVQYLEDDTRV